MWGMWFFILLVFLFLIMWEMDSRLRENDDFGGWCGVKKESVTST